MQEEDIYLPTAGTIPGLSGTHGPGRYRVDWQARAITPIIEAEAKQEDTTPEKPKKVTRTAKDVQSETSKTS